MAKKTNISNPLLIDKIEKYLTKNYIFILSTIGIIIIIIFSFQLINSFLDKKNKKIYNKLGNYEISVVNGSFTIDDVDKLVSIANEHKSIRDYSYLKSAILYSKLDKDDKALPLLENNKTFNELSKSLLYDIGKDIDSNQFKTKGNLKSLWAYRSILADNKITNEEIDSFKKEYTTSQLLLLLENWQE
jgi:hypothetical protein